MKTLTNEEVHHRCLEVMGWKLDFGSHGHVSPNYGIITYDLPPMDANLAAEMRKALTEEEQARFITELLHTIKSCWHWHVLQSDPLTQCRICLEIVEGRAGK